MPFEDLNNTVVDILERLRPSLPDAPALLDIDCGRGQLASAARDAARNRVDELLPVDLADQEKVAAALNDRKFDIILFADVLEHTPDPLSVLLFYLRFLKSGGRIVVSLPNIACRDRRLALLFGHFDYTDSGIMDRTHLRFFTFHTAQALLREAGLAICSVRHAPGITRAFLPFIKQFFFKSSSGPLDPGEILNSSTYRLHERRVLAAEASLSGLWRGLLSFRIVLVGAVREISLSGLQGCA